VALGGDGAALQADQVRPADGVAAFLVRQIRDGFIPHRMLAVHGGFLLAAARFPRTAIIPRKRLFMAAQPPGIAPNSGIGESRQ
jgi:hypothetical protein